MATESKSKSQEIRDYVSGLTDKKVGPSAIVAALKEKGIVVSSQLVTQVVTRMKDNKAKAKTKAKTSVKTKAKAKAIGGTRFISDFGMETWIIAKNLLASCGGDLTAAKKNLDLVSRLISS